MVPFFRAKTVEHPINVGKIINPLFLAFLCGSRSYVLLLSWFCSLPCPTGEYAAHPFFFRVILGGYNTMDALASLAFGIIIINAVRNPV